VWVVLLVLAIGALLVQRALYHASYLSQSPFARATFSDGQIYEEAARDILAHPPLGSAPFFLQGAYAYLLALGLWPRGELLDALLLQLGLSIVALVSFQRCALGFFGARGACVAGLALLSNAALAFYENKFLSAALGVACNCAVVAAYGGVRQRPSGLRAALLGACSGLSVLARPNLVLALPFSAWALWRAAPDARRARQLLGAGALGCMLSLAPLAARNLIVTGRASVFPSHGGGIPFYIGNHPTSTGLWNNAGGLLSGQVLLERQELAARLGLSASAPDLDQRIGDALYARALGFMREQPLAWLQLEATKLWYALGNQELVHDYDLLGERELLGERFPLRVPFGVVLGLGALGLLALARGAPGERELAVVLAGQLCAVLAANLLWFTSAQNRLPLLVPLSLAAAPGLSVLLRGWRGWRWALAAISCTLLCLQAFVPRKPERRPSAAHYYNLANAEESLGQNDAALAHYTRAAERRPQEPMFWFRTAYLARKLGKTDVARAALGKLESMKLEGPMARVVREERALLGPP